MMINRREFVVGAAAVVATPVLKPILKPKLAQADTLPWAVNLDGSSYLQNDGGIANVPSSPSFTGTLVFKYRAALTPITGGFFTIGGFDCGIPHRAATIIWDRNRLVLELWGPKANALCNATNAVQAVVSNMPGGDSWHDVIVSWYGANGTVKVMVDGQTQSVSITNYNGYDVATDFTNICTIGGTLNGNYTGDLADVGLFAGGAFIEPDSILDNLYDVERGFSMRNASNGSGIVPNRRPQIWLSGPAKLFPMNLAAGTWAWPATHNDTSPTSSFTIVGNLATATSDPFEPGT